MGGCLSPTILAKLTELFDHLGWGLGDPAYGGAAPVYEQFAECLERLDSDDTREFVLQVSREFLWCKAEHYWPLMAEVLAEACESALDGATELHVASLKKFDSTSTKSGSMLLYPARTWLERRGLPPREVKVTGDDVLTRDGALSVLEAGRTIVLLDDFLGTGRSALKLLDPLLELYPGAQAQVVVIVLVAQQRGVSKLRARGWTTLAARVRSRGLSDRTDLGAVRDALLAMRKVSSLLKVKPLDEFGYRGSQSLVAMINTPNNTFPFYQVTRARGVGVWPAPFPRVRSR